jgi:hypothetical protein
MPAPIPACDGGAVILIDPPMWPRHGRLWRHLVSDTDLAELHAFAADAGIPSRGFDHDHRRRQPRLGRVTPTEFETIMTTTAALAA